MKRTRAERRVNRDKFRSKTKKIVKDIWRTSKEHIDNLVKIFEKNRKKCGKKCCKNEKYREERAKINDDLRKSIRDSN